MKTIAKLIVSLSLMSALTDNAPAIADAGGPKIGDFPPPLTLAKTIQGPPASEISWDKLKGKVVVLEFWATWCGPCVKAIPHLNKLVEEFRGKPVVFIYVTSENEDVVRLFLKKDPIKAWIGLDDYQVLNHEFHVEGIPHAVIVGADGRIAAIAHPAKIEAKNLEEVLAGEKCSLPPPAVYTIDRRSGEVISNEAPPLFEISIREHKMPPDIRGPICMWSNNRDGSGFKGEIATVESALNYVFDKSAVRTEIKCKLPDGFYDFDLRAPVGHSNELQNEFASALRTTFGLEVKQTAKVMDVYLLTQISTNAPGLRKAKTPGGGGETQAGFQFRGGHMQTVADYLEIALDKPVFNETHLKGIYDVDMKWKLSEAERQGEFKPNADAVISAARERLGLRLTPAHRPVAILEVKKATP